MRIPLLTFLLSFVPLVCFETLLVVAFAPHWIRRQHATTNLGSVSVPISELEKDLTPEERSITSVVRKCGPSVAFVTSVLPSRTRSRNRNTNTNAKNNKNEPSGQSLGSGSGFQVSPGYVCTNYHVIERAYSIQKNSKMIDEMIGQFAQNITRFLPEEFSNCNTTTKLYNLTQTQGELPIVYVRIDSETKYQKCKIVDVEPDLDLAVLKVEDEQDVGSVVSFGSSSNLLVGQTVVAIGNPFGLDKTVTTGVVSAVNREFRAGTARTPANRPIKNCVQTDAAINPGNSGGPLLNLKGEVIGINTAIITTSGSNAGIGFAVPSDQIEPVVDRIIQQDRIDTKQRPDKGWLGISIIKQIGNSTISQKNWVESVQGPAEESGIQPLKISGNGTVQFGDAIVAVGGNEVSNFEDLVAQLDDRVKGEQLSLTLEDIDGERRVTYVTLSDRPSRG